jgi:uncharacterized protein YsxB (DUF464 family)
MTKITIFKSDNVYKGFECTDHAGFARKGKDIVCASISVLTINTINSIEKFTDDSFDLDTDEKKGHIRFDLKNAPSEKTEVLLDSMVSGLSDIATQYGDRYLHLEFEEV